MKNRNFLKYILLFGDIALMYGTLLLALAVRYGDFSFLPGPGTRVFLYEFSFVFIFWVLILYAFNFYEVPPLRKIFEFLKNLLIFSFFAGAFAVGYFYFRPESLITPKTILVLHVAFFAATVYLWRYFLSLALKTRNFREKIIIIGFRPGLKELIKEDFFSQAGYEVVAFFAPDKESFEKLSSVSRRTKHGTVSDVKEIKKIIEKEGVVTVVFPRFISGNEELMRKIYSSLPFKLNYVSFADFYEFLTGKVPIDAVNESWFLENVSRSEKKAEAIFKRVFDIFLSFLGTLVFMVLFPFVALAIKIDSRGPVFYTQKRVGKDREVFTLYKFRTMKVSAKEKEELWREKDKNQITRVGKVLRNLHLDEIPQILHIFKGDLSFVGPRPEWLELVKMFEKKIPFYSLRCVIKPGITGWAQLHYPPSASVEEAKEKFKYDLYYIKNRSFFLDLSIILKTLRKIF